MPMPAVVFPGQTFPDPLAGLPEATKNILDAILERRRQKAIDEDLAVLGQGGGDPRYLEALLSRGYSAGATGDYVGELMNANSPLLSNVGRGLKTTEGRKMALQMLAKSREPVLVGEGSALVEPGTHRELYRNPKEAKREKVEAWRRRPDGTVQTAKFPEGQVPEGWTEGDIKADPAASGENKVDVRSPVKIKGADGKPHEVMPIVQGGKLIGRIDLGQAGDQTDLSIVMRAAQDAVQTFNSDLKNLQLSPEEAQKKLDDLTWKNVENIKRNVARTEGKAAPPSSKKPYTGTSAPANYPQAKRGKDGYWYVPLKGGGWGRVLQ